MTNEKYIGFSNLIICNSSINFENNPIEPKEIVSGLNIKNFKNVEAFFMKDVNKEDSNLFFTSVEFEKIDDITTDERNFFVIRIKKNLIEYLIPPAENFDYNKIIDDISGDGNLINLGLFRIYGEKRDFIFNSKLGFRIKNQEHIRRFNSFIDLINKECDVNKNLDYKIEGITFKFINNNYNISIEKEEKNNSSPPKENYILIAEFEEKTQLTFAEIDFKKHIRFHIEKLNQIFNSLI